MTFIMILVFGEELILKIIMKKYINGYNRNLLIEEGNKYDLKKLLIIIKTIIIILYP